MASSGHMGYVWKTAFLPALPGEDRESGTVCNVVSPDKRRPGRGLGHNDFRPAGRRRGPRAERQRCFHGARRGGRRRSEEHTSELQSLMRISYAVFCLKKKNKQTLASRERSKTINTQR